MTSRPLGPQDASAAKMIQNKKTDGLILPS